MKSGSIRDLTINGIISERGPGISERSRSENPIAAGYRVRREWRESATDRGRDKPQPNGRQAKETISAMVKVGYGVSVGRDKPQPLLYHPEGCAGSRHPLGQ